VFKSGLALYSIRKQKYQNGNIHRKLRVPTSEREGNLSNPRGGAGAPGARDAWRKFTELYGTPRGGAPREPRTYFAAAKNTILVHVRNLATEPGVSGRTLLLPGTFAHALVVLHNTLPAGHETFHDG
jgi:hypothetical protein